MNLGGKTVLPGLIDSHVHAPSASMYEFGQPVPEMESIEDVLAYIRSRAEATEPGRWITLSQVFITRLREQRYPTRAELDRAAPRHLVAFRTGPDASLNSMALAKSGIDAKFEVPEGQPCRVERDRNGEPTGILRNCGRYIRSESSGPTPTDADRLKRLRELLADYNSVGITSIVDANADREGLEQYRTLLGQNALTCRTFLAYGVDAQAPLDRIEAAIRETAAHPLHQQSDMLWLRGIKAFLDGGMLTGSAYMRRPWGVSKIYAIDDPEYRGVRFIEPEKLLSDREARARQRPAVHGSLARRRRSRCHDRRLRANQSRRLSRSRSTSQHHPRQLHEPRGHRENEDAWGGCQPAAGLALSRRHHASAALRPRATRLFPPVPHALRGGRRGWRGSDHMQKIGSLRSINPYNPFLGMWTTIVRRPRGADAPLNPEQNLTREQAIRLYTINNAFLTFEETRKGSLEPGKVGDFIVLDRDILTCPIDEVKNITVEATYLGGRRVYTRTTR